MEIDYPRESNFIGIYSRQEKGNIFQDVCIRSSRIVKPRRINEINGSLVAVLKAVDADFGRAFSVSWVAQSPESTYMKSNYAQL